MTGPHAAYVLGHNPYAFRLHELVNWGLGPLVLEGEGAENVLKALRQLSVAIDQLGPDLCPAVLPDMKELVQRFEADWANWLCCWSEGKRYEGPFTDADLGEGRDERERLCALAEEALVSSRELHALVQFGLALGEEEYAAFVLMQDRWRVNDGSQAPEQGLPDLSRLVRSAERLSPRLLAALPEVRRLVTFGPRLADLGAAAFVDRVLGTHPAAVRGFIPLQTVCEFFRILDERVRGRLQHVQDDPAARKPRWDANKKTLWYGSTVCVQYKKQARNQMRILAAFEEEGWPARIDDPLDPGTLRATIADLQEKLKACNAPIFIECDGTGGGLCWGLRAG
jgi:hypothetical protein